MADSMCGPSNPLATFRKHTSTDRTIQQDRLVSRHSPAPGFRSAAGPTAGLLDPEFEAFQAGFDPATLIQPEPHHHTQHHFSGPPSFIQPVAAPAWALDFQRQNVSPPQPSSFSHEPQSSRHPQTHQNAWHHDFQNQYPSTAYYQAQQPQYQSRLYNGYSSSARPDQYTFSIPMPQIDQDVQLLDRGKEKQIEDTHDAAAFERAFEEHAAELIRLETEVRSRSGSLNMSRTFSLGEEALMDDGSTLEDIQQRIAELQLESQRLAREQQDHTLRETEELSRRGEELLGHDLAGPMSQGYEQQEAESQEFQPPSTDYELAQTARELLEKVSDNTTEKFQQSNFLALMRKLRDGEMRVEGDKMVETTDGGNISAPTTATMGAGDADLGRTYTEHGEIRNSNSLNSGYNPWRSEPPRAALDPPRNPYLYHHMVDDF